MKPLHTISLVCLALLSLSGSWCAHAALTATWIQKSSVQGVPFGPGSRVWIDLAYDKVNGKTFVFGGSGDTYLNDIWHYNSVTDSWTNIEPVVTSCTGFIPPTRRDEHSVEYDSFNHLYWSFGGSGFCAAVTSTAQSGTNTLAVVDSNLSSNVPNFYKDWFVDVNGNRSDVTGYDPTTKTIALATPISGLTAGTSYRLFAQGGGGTWYYSPPTQTWASLDGTHWGYIGQKPLSRLSPAFSYSDNDHVILAFGGSANGAPRNDTWVLDVENKAWLQMRPNGDATSPPAREQLTNSMVYDSRDGVFILFGGRCGDASRCQFAASLGDTWIYRLSTNTWTKMNPSVSPPPRQQHHMAYDPVNGVVVLFAGRGDTTVYNDLWVYNYPMNTWTRLFPAISPPPWYTGGLSYDSDQNAFVHYGGIQAGVGGGIWVLTLQGDGPINKPPFPFATVSPTSGTVATLFNFNGTGSSDPDGAVTGYLWNFGDVATSTAISPTHQYTAPGTYTVTLTVTDNNGATGVASLSLTVISDTTPPQISLTSSTLTGTVGDPGASITANGSPVTITNGAFEITAPLNIGTTTIDVTATGIGGASTRKVTITVQ